MNKIGRSFRGALIVVRIYNFQVLVIFGICNIIELSKSYAYYFFRGN